MWKALVNNKRKLPYFVVSSKLPDLEYLLILVSSNFSEIETRSAPEDIIFCNKSNIIDPGFCGGAINCVITIIPLWWINRI